MSNTFFENNVDFNSLEEAEGASFQLIPPDTEVPAVAVKSEVKVNDKGSVSFYYEFQIIEGEYSGYKIWKNFNWQNKNDKAQLIGQNEVKTFLSALNFTDKFNDTTQLHDKPVVLVIDVEPSKPTNIDPKTGQPYPAKNVIKGSGSKLGIKPYGGTAAVAKTAAAPAPAKPAWGKK